MNGTSEIDTRITQMSGVDVIVIDCDEDETVMYNHKSLNNFCVPVDGLSLSRSLFPFMSKSISIIDLPYALNQFASKKSPSRFIHNEMEIYFQVLSEKNAFKYKLFCVVDRWSFKCWSMTFGKWMPFNLYKMEKRFGKSLLKSIWIEWIRHIDMHRGVKKSYNKNDGRVPSHLHISVSFRSTFKHSISFLFLPSYKCIS